MFTEGQSTMAVVFSFRGLVKWFMIWAVFSASRRFRFLWSSISFGDEERMWCLNWGLIFSAIVLLWRGVNNFESFALRDFRISSSSGFIITPARIIGPRTGPLPASSIPRSFMS